MLEAVELLVNDLKKNRDVAGILLASTEKSGARVAVMVNERREYYRRGQAMNGVWIEQYFNTFERLIRAIRNKDKAHVYIIKSGDILYDPEEHFSELRGLAKRIELEGEKTLSKSEGEVWQWIFRSLVQYCRVPSTGIREYIITILRKEWGEIPTYLMEAQWNTQWIDLNELRLDIGVLASDLFMKEIRERMRYQQTRIWNDEPIEPIVAVRNRWLWLIDGYARTYALERLGLNESMAHVGRVEGFAGP